MALIDEARRRGLFDPAPAAPSQYVSGLAAHAMAQRPAYRTGGLIEGPGTETSDSIPAEVPEGTYILPADTTRAAGLASRASEPVMPVALSDGEFEITPEQLQSIGAAVLDILRGVTHTPVEPEPAVVEEQGYANGGEVTRIGNSYSGGNVTGDIAVNGQAPGGTFSQVPGGATGAMQAPSTPAASAASNTQSGTAVAATPSGAANPAVVGAPAPAMGWAERNAQRSLEVSASSIKPSAERDFAQSRLAAMSQPSMSVAPNLAAPAVGAPTVPLTNPLASTLPQPAGQQRAPLGAPSSFAPRQRFANGGLVADEERRQGLIAQIPAGAPTPFPAAPAVDPGAGQLSRAVSGPSTSLAAAGMASAAQAAAPAAMPQAPASNSLVSAAGVPAYSSAPAPAPSPSLSNPLMDAAAQRNNGMISAGNEAAATNMSQRQGLAAYATSQPPQAGFSGVIGQQGNGNMWSRTPEQQRRDAEVQASSIHRPTAAFGAAALRSMDAQDLEGIRGRNSLAQAALEQQGAYNRTTLQEQGAGDRAALADAGALSRTLITERGNNSRASITAEGQALAAALKARQAAAGKVPEGYRVTANGNLEAIPGGPADFRQNKDSQQQGKDTQDIFSILDQARPLLDKSTQSYAGNAADKVAQTFGVATEGAQAAAQLRALEGALVSKMPKMSGPQSDKDVLLYKQMAGQIGDPTIPADQRRAAMGTIEQLNMKYLPAAIDEASYQAVPSGSYYRIPSGEIRRKN